MGAVRSAAPLRLAGRQDRPGSNQTVSARGSGWRRSKEHLVQGRASRAAALLVSLRAHQSFPSRFLALQPGHSRPGPWPGAAARRPTEGTRRAARLAARLVGVSTGRDVGEVQLHSDTNTVRSVVRDPAKSHAQDQPIDDRTPPRPAPPSDGPFGWTGVERAAPDIQTRKACHLSHASSGKALKRVSPPASPRPSEPSPLLAGEMLEPCWSRPDGSLE